MFDGEEFHSEDDQREDSTSNRGISRAESVRDSVRQPSVTVRREDSGLSHIQGGEVIEMEVINQSASADCNGGHEPDPNISQHALSTSLASSLLNQLQPLENNTEQVYPTSRLRLALHGTRHIFYCSNIRPVCTILFCLHGTGPKFAWLGVSIFVQIAHFHVNRTRA